MGLAFAAGAMLYVISHEIIPETHSIGHQKQATTGLAIGLVVMLFLDVWLGRKMTIHSLGICASVVAFAADQASKAVVLANADPLAVSVNVAPAFNLVLHRNTGVTFGLLQGIPWWALAMLAVAIVLFLALSLVRATSIAEAVAYGMVIGGGLGNILDRFRFGGVTDFLDFYFGTTHWPVFNLADVFVVFGIGMLLIAAGREHAAMKKASE